MPRRLMPLALLLLLFTPLASCTSVEWQAPPPELPQTWRNYRLFVSDTAYVLAKDEDAAAGVHETVSRVRNAVSDALHGDPGRGLIVALSFDDPLPIQDFDEYLEAIHAWHDSVIGHRGLRPRPDRNPRGRNGEEVEIDPAIPYRMLVTPIAKEDTRLALPEALVDVATFAAIVPTEDCLDECIDASIDAMLEAQGISSITYAAVAAIMGSPAAMMREKVTEYFDKVLRQTWIAELGGQLPPTGMPSVDTIPASGEPLPETWAELVYHEARFARSEPWFIVGDYLKTNQRSVVEPSPIQGFVDVAQGQRQTPSDSILSADKRFVRIPGSRKSPSRAAAEQLGAFYDSCRYKGDGTFVYVFGDHEFGPQLVGAHAYWVLGKSADEAVEVARGFGATRLDQLRASFGER